MDTTTINGLHKCQPKNAPRQGEVKNMVVLNMPAKNGKKAWIKIKSEKPEKGGSPYRILGVDKLEWPPDDYGNIAFNIEVEASSGPPSTVQNLRATMQPDEALAKTLNEHDAEQGKFRQERIENALQSSVHAQQGEDGVMATRKHLMQVANLYALCVRCANSHVIADEIPFAHKTNEQFQSTLASIWIEASGRRSTNGVDWWSFIDKMPTTPLVPNGKHSATAKPIQKEEETDVPF